MAENKFLDDIAKFGNSTLSAMSTMQRQVRKWVSEQVDSMIEAADLVTKKELEAYKKRIDELEKHINSFENATSRAASKPKAAAEQKPKAKKKAS